MISDTDKTTQPQTKELTKSVSESLCSARQSAVVQSVNRLDDSVHELKKLVQKMTESILGNGKQGLERRTSFLETEVARLITQSGNTAEEVRKMRLQEAERKEAMREVVRAELDTFKDALEEQRKTFRYYLSPALSLIYGIILAAFIYWITNGAPR